MPEDITVDLSERLRLFLEDLRSGSERRSWDERRHCERRQANLGVATERRNVGERRSNTDRRVMLLDRRRRISEPYAQRHAEQIRSMVVNPGAGASCPRCDGNLLLGPTISRNDGFAREVRCTNCRHSVVITQLPE
jgi:hypothetical protein